MAKDKSKKKDTKPTVEDGFGKPSEAKGGGDGWKFEADENIGQLFLITPKEEKDFSHEKWGDSKIIVADVVAIDKKNPAKSEEHTDVYVFGGWTKGALRDSIGKRRVLAVLAQDAEKGIGKNPAWTLEDASPKQAEQAKEYLKSLIEGFGKPGADDDDKPSKKDKSAKSKKNDDDAKSEKKSKGEKAGKSKGDEPEGKKSKKKK